MLYAALKPFAVALMRLFFRLEVVNPALVPATGPVLLVSNHVSVLDPPLIGGAAPRPLSFMAKEELFRIPLFGRLIRALNARPVRRDGSDMRALKAGSCQGMLSPSAQGRGSDSRWTMSRMRMAGNPGLLGCEVGRNLAPIIA